MKGADQDTFGPATLAGFQVSLDNFEGPFDLLLRLIAQREMDLTQVALSEVTDEFLGYVRKDPSLSSATDFLVVAATLLHMKSAALLPRVEDDVDLVEDLEAWDLLFARLLQYRAFKEIAADFSHRWGSNAGGVGRAVPMEEPYASMLSPLKWNVTPEHLASLASSVLMQPVRPDEAEHIAREEVPFERELEVVRRLVSDGPTSFQGLTAGEGPAVVVARFLALLVLYRKRVVTFEQSAPMGKLLILPLDPQDSAESLDPEEGDLM